MTDLDIAKIDNGDLRAQATRDGGSLRVGFVGSADTHAGPALDSLLRSVHKAALAAKTREVIVDFRELEFMNSSCFKAFVAWLGDLQNLDVDKQYRIRFLSDDSKHWQRRSLSALSCFAVDLVQIET
jgi:hypothetical protein